MKLVLLENVHSDEALEAGRAAEAGPGSVSFGPETEIGQLKSRPKIRIPIGGKCRIRIFARP